MYLIVFLPGVCPEPGGVPFSVRTKYNGPYNTGSQVIYNCYDGGSGTIICLNNRNWTHKPICTGWHEICLK